MTPEPIGQGFEAGIAGLRIARLGGWSARHRLAESDAVLDAACAALGVTEVTDLPEAERARGAAFLITMAKRPGPASSKSGVGFIPETDPPGGQGCKAG